MTVTVLFASDDQFVGDVTDDQIFGMAGNDTLNGWTGNDKLYGGDGNDRLGDGAGKDEYYGGAGNDIIIASFGDFGDIADGGAGQDTIDLDYSLDTIGGLSITFGANFQVLVGGSTAITVSGMEALSMNASHLDDTISCGDGNDRIFLNGGNDVVSCAGGDDTIFASGHFALTGGAGNDLLSLNMSSVTQAVVIDVNRPVIRLNTPTISGTAADFEQLNLTGGSGNDAFTGGALNDTFYGGSGGSDTVHGLGGNDVLGLNAGSVGYGEAGNDVINNASQAYGGAGDDRLQGTAANDMLSGGTGNDQLFGNGGSDTLLGGDGNDSLQNLVSGLMDAGTGDDYVQVFLDLSAETVNGGVGNDLLGVSLGVASSHLGMVINGAGMDLLINGVVIETAQSFERFSVSGGGLADTLVGQAGNDSLFGSFGAPGAADADSLLGNGGNDFLSGGDGADTLVGGIGADWLEGGRDADLLRGGLGADKFVYRQTTDSAVSVSDRIVDFVQGQDLIDLHFIDATPTDSLTDAFHFIGRGPLDGLAGALGYSFSGASTRVFADLTGDGVADMMITLTGRIALTATDFVL